MRQHPTGHQHTALACESTGGSVRLARQIQPTVFSFNEKGLQNMKSQFLPVLPWMGGKRRLARHILPLFPSHTCYVEPFCGAAALYFMKEPSKVEVINDIHGELINLYRVIKHHLDEFVRQFRWALVSRQIYRWMKDTPEETLTDIQRAARFFYLQKQAFGGKVADHTFGTTTTSAPRLNLLRIEEELSLAHLRLSRTTIEHLDWANCIKRYDRPHTLFYCDPPYLKTEGYGVEFGLDEYVRMAELARTISGKMVISVNDIEEMRTAFAGLRIQTVDIRYNLQTTGKAELRKELIICNF